MKAFKKDNVILRTNDPRKEQELLSRGFEHIEWPIKKEKKQANKQGQGTKQENKKQEDKKEGAPDAK